jgi:hypothetical protein
MPCGEQFLLQHVGDDVGGQKVRTDRDVGIFGLQALDERLHLKALYGNAKMFSLPRRIAFVVPPSPKRGRFFDQLRVQIRIEHSEQRRRIFEHIDMLYRGDARHVGGGSFQRFGSTGMPAAGAGR